MNQDQSEPSFDESVKQVMDTLPPVIYAYLVQKKYTVVARSLMAKYSLRIDQGGILERGMMLLLMGIEDPAEFSKALVEEAKLDQRTVNGIMQDINEQIFVPLRDEMRKVAPVAPEAAKPAAPQPQQSAKPLVPAPLQGAAATPPRPLLVGAKPPQILIPAAPISPRPALRDVLSAVMKVPPAPQKAAPPPPSNLPGTMPERPAVSDKAQGAGFPIPLKSSTSPLTPSSAPPKPIAPITSYSTDPYREPLDEK